MSSGRDAPSWLLAALLVLGTIGQPGFAQWQDPVPHVIRATPEVEHGQRAIPVDIDGDGDQDVVTSYSLSDELVLELNGGVGSGDGSAWTPVSVAAAGTWVGMFADAADLDGDGDLDIAGVALFDRNVCDFCSPGRVAWFEQAGDPGAGTSDPTSWTLHTIDPALEAARYLDLGDIDGDGDPDLAVVSSADFGGGGDLPHAAVWYENRLDEASGDFQRHVIATGLINPESIRLGQIDGGADLEVLIAEYEGNRVSWYRSGGLPTASPWTGVSIAFPAGPTSARPWDMNGDLRLDAVVGVHDGGQVLWYEQPADPVNGTWAAHPVAAVDFATDLARGDLDNDGDADLVVSTTDWFSGGVPGTVTYLEADSGTWTPHAVDYTGASSAEVADLDGDGDLDVVATSYDVHRTDWFENTHPGIDPDPIFADGFESGDVTAWSRSVP